METGDVEASPFKNYPGPLKRQPVHGFVDHQGREHVGTGEGSVNDPLLRWWGDADLPFAEPADLFLSEVFDHFELGRRVLDDHAAEISEGASLGAALGTRSLLGRDGICSVRVGCRGRRLFFCFGSVSFGTSSFLVFCYFSARAKTV